jgi:hypothetical protein
MSKYLVYVLVPETSGSLEESVDYLLWPYHVDSLLEIEESEDEDDCECTSEGQTADPNCEVCNGTGVEKFYRNPKSRWDSYFLSGEWEGKLLLAECLLRPCKLKLNGGAAPLNNLDVERLEMPRAIVTPDGRWHDECNYPSDWPTKYKEILRSHEDTILVCVLCHL